MSSRESLPGRVRVDDRGPIGVVHLVGEIDLACVPDLIVAAERLRSLPQTASRNALVVDLTATTFLGLVGVQFLEEIERDTADGGGLLVVGGSQQVHRLLRLVGLDRLVLQPL